jgi:regulatory protein
MAGRRRKRSTAESLAALRESRATLTDTGPVMDAAATFLGVRPRSVAETSRRLLHLGYPQALVDTVVERLVEMNYLNDRDFAQAWVESRDRAKPRGEMALRRELSVKGVPKSVVDEVLLERASSEGEEPNRVAAVALLARRRSALDREADPARRRQKAYALLARNGFDPETCHQAASQFVAE